MSWRPDQMLRLAQERALLQLHMPDFSMQEPLGNTNVFGHWISNLGNYYTIRITIPAGYPDECLKTYLEYSSPLLDYFNMPMTRHGSNHEYHTWATDRAGYVQLCTYRPEYWDASNTLIQLIQKSFLWIIAYENHRQTGRYIKDALLDM